MNKKKILHITTFKKGGSGIAALRLHNALLQHGYESKFLFLYKGEESDTAFQYHKKIHLFDLVLRVLKKIGLPLNMEQKNDFSIRKYKYKIELFSFAKTPYPNVHQHPLVKEADIIHLHFISNFIDFKTFFRYNEKPIVWTLHDMNPFQGGFHYKEDENRFRKAMIDVDDEQIRLKKEALNSVPLYKLTLVTPSKWLQHLSEQSDLLSRFPHYCIPNGIDTDIFTINKKSKSQKSKVNILFVAESLHNYRKGFDFILEILQDKTILNSCHFTAVGHVKKSSQLPEIKYEGSINDEKKISQIYNDADIFLLPSREDNLPNAMVESLCCGTPVVGFNIGGLTETITNGENGYLANEMSAKGLKEALLICIKNIDKLDRSTISEIAKSKFSTETQVKAFGKLYEKLLYLNLLKS